MVRVLLFRVFLLNLLVFSPFYSLEHFGLFSPVSFICQAAVLFCPGLLITRFSRQADRSPVYWFFRGLMLSFLINLSVSFIIYGWDLARDPFSFLVIMAVTANCFLAGSYFFHVRQGQESSLRETFSQLRRNLSRQKILAQIMMCLILSLALILIHQVKISLHIIYDLETFHIGSAYGLMKNFKPAMWPSVPDKTFREFNYSRPPLTHLYTAWSIQLAGLLPETEPYYSFTKVPLEVRPRPETFWINGEKTDFPSEKIANAQGGNGQGVRIKVAPSIPISEKLLMAGRIPQAFAFWFSLILLIYFFRAHQIRLEWQVLGLLLYLSMPEVLIRGASASAVPMTYLFYLFLIYFFLDTDQEKKRRDRYIFATSFILFWVNQKSAVFGLGVILWRFARYNSFKEIITDASVLGFGSGFFTYAVYGLWCDPLDFFHAFLAEQGINRFLLFRVLPPQDRIYPDVVHLWLQFNQFLGHPFLFVSGIVLLISSWHYKRKQGIFIFWFMITFILGSLIDRRMTRHVTTAIMPLFLPFVLTANRSSPNWRYILGVIVIYIILTNSTLDWTIVTNFDEISPLPAW
ncbi:hypothetical protein ACFL27_28960 [candidate division CSSED10-310 bacterium]|uniref:Glycosyltransferase RgtA/B/C/D-like domain-containing protein n=1 Tax=candidate division CSSED10-310 bacterium TaxID=2855610 RepID=A0ABV6Z711_UNCC1